MKKIAALFFVFSCFIGSHVCAEHNFPSWNEWAPQVNIASNVLSQFRSKLPSKGQAAWDGSSVATQRIAYLIMLGMRQAGNNQIADDDYYTAFKIANKAEAGFYADKVAKVLSYPK